MGKFIKKIAVIFGGLGIGQLANAKAITHESDLIRFIDPQVKAGSIGRKCEAFLKLEDKNNLSEREMELGIMLHEIISQISDEPLAYCEHLAMRSVIEQPK